MASESFLAAQRLRPPATRCPPRPPLPGGSGGIGGSGGGGGYNGSIQLEPLVVRPELRGIACRYEKSAPPPAPGGEVCLAKGLCGIGFSKEPERGGGRELALLRRALSQTPLPQSPRQQRRSASASLGKRSHAAHFATPADAVGPVPVPLAAATQSSAQGLAHGMQELAASAPAVGSRGSSGRTSRSSRPHASRPPSAPLTGGSSAGIALASDAPAPDASAASAARQRAQLGSNTARAGASSRERGDRGKVREGDNGAAVSSPSRPARRNTVGATSARRPASNAGDEQKGDSPTSPGVEPAALRWAWLPNIAWAPSLKRKEPKIKICLLRSAFAGRPPVLFFDGGCAAPVAGSPRCGAFSPRNFVASRADKSSLAEPRVVSDEELEQEFGLGGLPKMYFALQTTKDVHEYKAVVNTLSSAGLYKTSVESGKWSLYWGPHPSVEMLRQFHPFQKANHFPASWHLGKKDLLWRCIAKMKRQWPKEFNITPASYVLPDDNATWASAREQNPSALWIYKPTNLACGKGIKLYSSKIETTELKKLTEKVGIVQRYLDQPLLINGFKFDLRIYIVVTSFDPLKAYINSEGLVRLATTPYDPSPSTLHEQTMHLTNYSINKLSSAYKKNLDGDSAVPGGSPARAGRPETSPTSLLPEEPEADDQEDGSEDEDVADTGTDGASGKASNVAPENASKWSLRQLQYHFEKHNLDWEGTMESIKELSIKTLQSAEPVIASTWQQGSGSTNIGGGLNPPPQTCFEIFGFDVMLDTNLKPWLLEVNVFPSLSSSSPFDKRVKTQLVADVMTLVGFQPFDHELVKNAVKEEHQKRLQGIHPKIQPARQNLQSLAGASLKDFGEMEWKIILDAHDEYLRRGSLERIYPTPQAVAKHAQHFASQRYANVVLQKWMEAGGEDIFRRGAGAKDAAEPKQVRSEVPAWVPQPVFGRC
eukprot:TRINITY_DN8666_c0_g1_i1.p1 TRINITY_DN8666_c0_g1~~TRINITY_DN8666_c0_g1_i1.p1  ORF type:complete len:938 (-),score=235.93 TRINITY_DN8666_c0_g1_i1:103-2916(-)